MGLIKRKTENKKTIPVQTAVSSKYYSHPFYELEAYTPLKTGEHRLYKTLREAIPVIDAAINKTVRLIGDFEVECETNKTTKELNNFLENVQVGSSTKGACCFVGEYLEQLLTFGTAVAEIVPNKTGTDIKALYQADLEYIHLSTKDDPLNVTVYKKNAVGAIEVLKYQQLLMVSALHPEPGKIYGNSILKGLPFVSSIFLKIINAVGKNWDRVGNVRFAVNYKPNADGSDGIYTKERAMQIASEWSKTMREENGVSDFVCVGDVDIKVIGADNQILDCQVPARLMLEQIISKLSIPPFLLGLSWSSTERMSSQQVDILTSELEYYRHILNPVISKICNMWLRLHGYNDSFKINWNNINLQDEVELANARLTNAQAKALEEELQEVKN